jgi:hypothetical protein
VCVCVRRDDNEEEERRMCACVVFVISVVVCKVCTMIEIRDKLMLVQTDCYTDKVSMCSWRLVERTHPHRLTHKHTLSVSFVPSSFPRRYQFCVSGKTIIWSHIL